MALDDRLLSFEACFNFRDLGGYPTKDGRASRWGRLFRSDTLHRLTDQDVAAFADLGLRTVIDMRTATELEDHGTLRQDGRDTLDWYHVPLFDGVMRLRARTEEELALMEAARSEQAVPGEAYLRMLGDGAGVGRVFDLLAGEGALPAVFHCTSGKDRTGMIAALTLDLLGVDADVIAADYVLTNETRARSNEWISQNEPDFAAFLAQIPLERQHTRPETILGFLDGVRNAYGSVEKMLREHGISAERIEQFRDNLLED
jgi:protein-tyrosine phosphatase